MDAECAPIDLRCDQTVCYSPVRTKSHHWTEPHQMLRPAHQHRLCRPVWCTIEKTDRLTHSDNRTHGSLLSSNLHGLLPNIFSATECGFFPEAGTKGYNTPSDQCYISGTNDSESLSKDNKLGQLGRASLKKSFHWWSQMLLREGMKADAEPSVSAKLWSKQQSKPYSTHSLFKKRCCRCCFFNLLEIKWKSELEIVFHTNLLFLRSTLLSTRVWNQIFITESYLLREHLKWVCQLVTAYAAFYP